MLYFRVKTLENYFSVQSVSSIFMVNVCDHNLTVDAEWCFILLGRGPNNTEKTPTIR